MFATSRGVELDPFDDGVTHINVYSMGRTRLGRRASHFANAPFHHPQYGFFAGMESFWYWYKTGMRHGELRTLIGHDAKIAGRRLEAIHTDDFEQTICKATYYRFLAHPDDLELLKDSTLPLVHYYMFNSMVKPVPNMDWIVENLESLRENFVVPR